MRPVYRVPLCGLKTRLQSVPGKRSWFAKRPRKRAAGPLRWCLLLLGSRKQDEALAKDIARQKMQVPACGIQGPGEWFSGRPEEPGSLAVCSVGPK